MEQPTPPKGTSYWSQPGTRTPKAPRAPGGPRHGVDLPRTTAGWCFGLAVIVGGVGVVAGFALGASSKAGGGYPEVAAVNNWPAGYAVIGAALLAAFWLSAAGVFFNWLAAVYEAVTAAKGKDGTS